MNVNRIGDEKLMEMALLIKSREPSFEVCNVKEMEVDFEKMKPSTVLAIQAFMKDLVVSKASPSSNDCGDSLPEEDSTPRVSSSSSSLDSKG